MKNAQQKPFPFFAYFFSKKSCLLALFFLKWMSWGATQNLLYFSGNVPTGYGLGYLNVETCEFCIEFEIPFSLFPQGMKDVVPLPNGNLVAIGGFGEVLVFNPPNPVPLSTSDLPGFTFAAAGVLLPNGNVYVSAVEILGGVSINRLYEFNPNTNTLVLVGSETGSNFGIGDIFFWQGTLYTFGTNADDDFALMSVQVGNPLVFTSIYTYPGLCGAPTATITSGSFSGIYTGAVSACSGLNVDVFDFPTNTTSFQCAVSPNGYPYGLGEVPSGFPPPPTNCACVTNAGEIPPQNAVLCPYENLIFSNTLGNLDPTDIKQFIIFSDFDDPAGSVLVTSNTPSFVFAPPLQTGVTYFVAAVAGNNLNGNVDFDDPCLDFSNIIEVIWNPSPTVSFSLSQNEICAGECQNVEVNFTGSPPFNLTFETSSGGQQTQNFTQNSGILQICPPAGFLGNLTVEVVSLSDENCVCQ